MADPIRTHTFRIGNQNRLMKFSSHALRIISKRFNGKTVMEVLEHIDWDSVCECAAAGMSAAGQKNISPERIGAWLDDEPTLFAPLAALVTEAIAQSYMRTLPSEDASQMGKEMAAVRAAAAAVVEAQTNQAANPEAPSPSTPSSPGEPSSSSSGGQTLPA